MIFLENLGQFKDDYIDICTIKTMIGKYRDSKYQWVSIARQVLEGISFLHQVAMLHNDIKADNVILLGEFRIAVKIIDFGKSTLLSNPLKFSLNHVEIMKCSKYHRHLTYELRNANWLLTQLVICFNWLVHLKSLIFFENVSKHMKSRRPIGRMSMDAGDKELTEFIQSYTFY